MRMYLARKFLAPMSETARRRVAETAPLWTSEEIASAVGASVIGAHFDASGLSIDTRELQAGDLFVALTGERDGNAFAPAAFRAGASGALVSRPVDRGAYIEVADTLTALERIAAAARDRAQAKRCAVTGSVGKTGVTQAIALALALAGRSHAPVKSFNNHIGVPLTLARMPRDTELAVFELGMNHPGEIGPLSRLVRPHVAVITTVGAVHIEAFEDGEAGVARAKAEVFEGLEPGGTAVLNADDGWFELLSERARVHGARVLSFGRGEGCDAQLLDFDSPSPQREGALVAVRVRGRTLRFSIAQTGAHWSMNSLAVLLAIDAMEVPIDIGVRALAAFAPLAGRGDEHRVQGQAGAFTVVDDSYNANPVSMHAALQALGAHPAKGRRIAVLTDMLELGGDAERRHADLAKPIEAFGIDQVFCAGPMMQALWAALPSSRRGGYAPTAEVLAPMISASIRAGDVVMAKGSNGSKASLIVKALLALGDSSVTVESGAG